MKRVSRFLTLAVALAFLSGCSTTAGKKAMNKPINNDSYTGFDHDRDSPSKRTAEKLKPVKDNQDPEAAIEQLVGFLQKDRSYAVGAEDQLKMWGSRNGNAPIVTRKVRLLLKHPNVEVRAPAVRLTMLFGGDEVNGDLIECLADPELSVRATAYKALQARTHRDFSYNPNSGEAARAKSVDSWRQWWQYEQRKVAVQPASTYETNPPREPRVARP